MQSFKEKPHPFLLKKSFFLTSFVASFLVVGALFLLPKTSKVSSPSAWDFFQNKDNLQGFFLLADQKTMNEEVTTSSTGSGVGAFFKKIGGFFTTVGSNLWTGLKTSVVFLATLVALPVTSVIGLFKSSRTSEE